MCGADPQISVRGLRECEDLSWRTVLSRPTGVYELTDGPVAGPCANRTRASQNNGDEKCPNAASPGGSTVGVRPGELRS